MTGSRWVVVVALAALTACAQLPPRPVLPEQHAIVIGQTARLDAMTAPLESAHAGQSGFRLVSDGTEAFVIRMQMAQRAERSLDIQSYIWHPDLSGMYLARELMRAAERGVRVRVLLDDIDARKPNDAIAALAAHRRIEVRTFNPFAARRGLLGLIGEATWRFGEINRRMHNKSWIADNRIAVVGGRNVGDEYFSAGDEFNFVDLDFAMLGPVVRDASASFDRYWNSVSAFPMKILDAERIGGEAQHKIEEQVAAHSDTVTGRRYAEAVRNDAGIVRMLAGDWPVHWSAHYRFVVDDPAKVLHGGAAPESEVGEALLPMLRDAQREVSIISPYFVPGEGGVRNLVTLVQQGRTVRVLTNSLAANDVTAVHGSYTRFRESLLRDGVQLWELKPLTGDLTSSSMFGSSGASLHSKAFMVDGSSLFVGSYNFDPRSTWLNCEQGVMVQSSALAAELAEIFARQTSGMHAWSVQLADGRLQWSDGQQRFDSEPMAPLSRRAQAWLFRLLHVDAQL